MKKFNLVYGLILAIFLSGCEEPLSAEEIGIRSVNISNASWWKSATAEMLKKKSIIRQMSILRISMANLR